MKKTLHILLTSLTILFFLLAAFCLLRLASGSLKMFPSPEQQQKARIISGIGMAVGLIAGTGCLIGAKRCAGK
ncbi:MAG: hypothetical protein E7331_09275 [Clostridiales bacterium]|nr:hypothetical protein [Clostridiales bacterium]